MRSGRPAEAQARPVVIREARPDDGPLLQRIDAATYSRAVAPTPAPEPDSEFFGERTCLENVLVAEVEDVTVGYVEVGPRYRQLTSARHVHQIWGLAVAPQSQGRGVGERLVMEAAEAARARGARRLTLKVLGTNLVARRLYERCGFVEEGVQPEQFYLDGRYVDDLLLGLDLTQLPDGGTTAGGPLAVTPR